MAADVTTLGIGVDSSGVRRATDDLTGFSRAGDEAAKAATGMERNMTGAVAAGAALGLAVAAATKFAFDAGKAFISLGMAAGEFQDISERTGATAEGLASLAPAAAVANTSVSAMATAMDNLAYRLTSTNAASERSSAALRALGIDAEHFKSLRADEQFRLVAQQMNGFADGAKKVAVARELFGRGGDQMLVALKEVGSETERSIRLTNEQIETADALSDALVRNTAEMRQMIQVAAVEALPAISDFMFAVRETAMDILGLSEAGDTLAANTAVRDFAEGAVKALAFVIDEVDLVIRSFRTAGRAIYGVAAAAFEIGRGELQAAKGQLNAAAKEIDEIWAAQTFGSRLEEKMRQREAERDRNSKTNRQRAVEDRGFVPELNYAGVEGKTKAVKALKDESIKSAEALAKLASEYNSLGQSDTERKVAEFSRLKGAEKFIDSYRSMLDAIADHKANAAIEKTIDGLREQAATFGMTNDQLTIYKLLMDGATDAQLREASAALQTAAAKREEAKARDEAKAAVESLMTPMEKYLEYTGRIAGLESRGLLTADQAQQLRAKSWADYEKTVQGAAKATQQLDEFTKQAARNIQSALGSSLEQALSGNFKSIGDLWSNMIRKMAAEAMAAKLNKLLLGDYGTSGQLGGWLGTLMQGFTGGPTTAGNGLPAGMIPSGVPMAEGTNFVPYDGFRASLHRGEAVVPAKYNPDAGGQRVVINSSPVINIDSRADQAQVGGIVSQALEKNNRMMIERMRAAGLGVA